MPLFFDPFAPAVGLGSEHSHADLAESCC